MGAFLLYFLEGTSVGPSYKTVINLEERKLDFKLYTRACSRLWFVGDMKTLFDFDQNMSECWPMIENSLCKKILCFPHSGSSFLNLIKIQKTIFVQLSDAWNFISLIQNTYTGPFEHGIFYWQFSLFP